MWTFRKGCRRPRCGPFYICRAGRRCGRPARSGPAGDEGADVVGRLLCCVADSGQCRLAPVEAGVVRNRRVRYCALPCGMLCRRVNSSECGMEDTGDGVGTAICSRLFPVVVHHTAGRLIDGTQGLAFAHSWPAYVNGRLTDDRGGVWAHHSWASLRGRLVPGGCADT